MLVSPVSQTDPSAVYRSYLARRKASPRSDRIADASFNREILKNSGTEDPDRREVMRQLWRRKAAIALRSVRTEARTHRLDIAV